MENTINCPHCNAEINIKSALQNQVSSEVNKEYKEHYAAKDAELKAREKALKENELNEKSQIEQNDILIKKGVEEGVKNLIPNIEKEVGFQYETVLAEAADTKKELLAYKQKEIQDNQDKETREAQQNLRDEKVRAKEADKQRAEFSKQREIDKIESEKQMDRQRSESKEQMKQMEATFKKGVRQVSQGSMQIQGEALEVSIENFLKEKYPFDTIESIKPGAKGADCLQHVTDNRGNNCGAIYLEIKRTKEFKKSWIKKFKADILEKDADYGVLITEVMPNKEETQPLVLEGIWICSLNDYKYVIESLRYLLLELNKVQVVTENVFDKQSRIYNFVTSKEFARLMDSLYDNYQEGAESLDYEERLMTKSWNKRRKNLITSNKIVSAVIGAFQSYSGDSISEIKALEMSEV